MNIRTLRKLRALGTRHPAWREGFTVREGPLHIQSGWRVTAIDASGAEFGFGIGAGWPEQARQMAVDLAIILNGLHDGPGSSVTGEAACAHEAVCAAGLCLDCGADVVPDAPTKEEQA